MPKVKGGVVKLVSLAGTGIFYTTRKNPKAATKKLLLRKYDPMLQRHTLFRVRFSLCLAILARLTHNLFFW
jgi:large subunit ribosomal protein L33